MSRKLGLVLVSMVSLSMTGCAREKQLVVHDGMARQIVPNAEMLWDVTYASLEAGFRPAAIQKIIDDDPEAFGVHARSHKEMIEPIGKVVQQPDPKKTYDMSAELDEAFESCHQAIWSSNAS